MNASAKGIAMAGVAAVALAVGVAYGGGRAETKSATPRLRTPEYLPVHARGLLRERMGRHGDDMMMLTATLLMLNYQGAEELADGIAREPRLSRPGPEDKDTLNALLPSQFFDLQDQLAQRARAVAAAAKSQDDRKVMKAYGRLAETCVACHATYFRGAPVTDGE